MTAKEKAQELYDNDIYECCGAYCGDAGCCPFSEKVMKEMDKLLDRLVEDTGNVLRGIEEQ